MWRAAYPGWTWVAPERWHLTLAFLGELSSGQRHRLTERLDPVAGATSQFSAQLAGAGAFPSEARARVLWVGVASAGLNDLAAAVRLAATGARIALDTKPFRPHITIARSRRDAAASDVPHLLRKLAVAERASWEVSRVVLLSSAGGPHPVYTELASWRLSGLVGDAEL